MTRVGTSHAPFTVAQEPSAHARVFSNGGTPAGAIDRLRVAANNPSGSVGITAGLSKENPQSDLHELLSDPQKLQELQKNRGIDITSANETGKPTKTGGKVVKTPHKPRDVNTLQKPEAFFNKKAERIDKWDLAFHWAEAQSGDFEALRTLVDVLCSKNSHEDHIDSLVEIRESIKKQEDSGGLFGGDFEFF